MELRIGDARREYARKNDIRFRQEEAARQFNVSLGTYRNWEQGRAGLSAAQLDDLADFYGVSVDYLLGRASETSEGGATEQELTKDERRFLELYRRCKPRNRAAARTVLEALTNHHP